MTCSCSDVQRILPEFLDGVPEGAAQTTVESRLAASAFDAHLKSCPACSGLVSDLKLIASEARQLAATEEPAPRLWVCIAAELRAEGIIREPGSASIRPILASASSRRRWSAWWLAPVAAVLLVAGSYVLSHKPAPPVAKQQAPATPATSPTPVTPAVTLAPVPSPAPQQLAQNSAEPTGTIRPAVRPAAEPEPSTEDQQFLSVVSTLAPAVRATYENQLQAVNADIRETQAYVDRNPADADARQHLMDAYQQKALLYQIALDRIQ
jgi:hypothetical protein